MIEPEYSTGKRILQDGTNLDSDIIAVHPKIQNREIFDPVSDGSLGYDGYEPGQHNKDGSLV